MGGKDEQHGECAGAKEEQHGECAGAKDEQHGQCAGATDGEKQVQPHAGKKPEPKKKGKAAKTPRIPTVVPKRDHHLRTSYLYKLGTMMSFKQLESGVSDGNKKSMDTLSRTYCNHMDLVSKKAVLKLHPDIKQTLCKKCSRLQVEGVTCSVRVRNGSRRQLPRCDVLEMECQCGNVKRYPIGQNLEYELFAERGGVLHGNGQTQKPKVGPK